MVCNNLESSCVRSGCGHAWTPRRDFAVSKSVTQSLTSAAWHSKRRAHTESHSAPTPSERVMGRLAVRLACKRSRTAFTSRSRCCEYRNGQGARLDYKFQTAKLWRGGQDVARDHDDGRVFYFSMGSTFRAITDAERASELNSTRLQRLARTGLALHRGR